MAAEQTEHEREIQVLESELKRLEAEYNMFFAGRVPRPPWETRTRVTGLFKKFDRIQNTITNYAVKFRFQTLQSRFSSQLDLWDRGLRSREEGRTSGPFAAPKTVERPKPTAKDRVVAVTTLSDPLHEMEKVRELYKNLVEARKEAGQEGLPFNKFADLIQKQVGSLRGQGNHEVAFRVALKDGKVAFTARAMKDGKDED